jgi:hypothetical protein
MATEGTPQKKHPSKRTDIAVGNGNHISIASMTASPSIDDDFQSLIGLVDIRTRHHASLMSLLGIFLTTHSDPQVCPFPEGA